MTSQVQIGMVAGTLALFTGLVAAGIPGALPATTAQEPRSTITVLVDLSQTWHNDQSRKQNQTALEVVFDAVVELGKRYRPPVHVRVLPIGDASLMRPALCEAIFDPKLISPPSNTGNVFSQEPRFRKYLKPDCLRFVLSRPKEKFTDISGAIDTATRLAAQQPGDDRAIIILSDMLEDIPKGQTPPPLALQGFRVLILYRVLPEDRQKSAQLDHRLERWTKKLRESGARVESIPDQGITAGQIDRLLRQ